MTKEQIDKIYENKIKFMEKINEAIHEDSNSIENVKLDIFEHPV